MNQISPPDNNLQLENSSADRVLVWDGWRGLAILMVLVGHFYDIKWVWEDRMGVDIFFVLSGMLMSIILFEKRMSLRDFYIRRFSRVYPAFLVCVLLMYAMGAVLGVEFKLSEVFANLTFLRTYLPLEPGVWETHVAVKHLWSLNIEEHAYVFLSAVSLIIFNRKNVAVVLLIVAIATIVLSFIHYQSLPETEFRLYLIRTECAVVFILFSAGYGLLSRQRAWSLPGWAPPVCVAVALLCYAQAAPLWLIFTVCPVMLGLAVNHLGDMPQLLKKILSNVVLRQFGMWSYSIYLWQQFFFEYSWRIPGGAIAALLISMLAGVLSYNLLEQPIRRRINNRWSARPVYRASDSNRLVQAG